jgi:hypothetical protein
MFDYISSEGVVDVRSENEWQNNIDMSARFSYLFRLTICRSQVGGVFLTICRSQTVGGVFARALLIISIHSPHWKLLSVA